MTRLAELSLWQSVVTALAVYRLTILVTADKLTARWREAVVLRLQERRHGPRPPASDSLDRMGWQSAVATDPHPLAYLVQCPWCVSVWIGAALTGGTILWGHSTAWLAVMLTLAFAAVAAILAVRYSPED